MQAISLSKQGHVKVDSKIRSRLIGLIWRESRVRRDKVNSQIAGLKGSAGNWICDQEMSFLPELVSSIKRTEVLLSVEKKGASP